MSALSLVVIGSGSGLPTASRDTAAYLIRCGEDVTLVECPGSVVQKLLRHGVAIGDLSRLVLTHDHVDHIYGLPHLLHAMAINGGCPPLEIFAPQQTLARVEEILRAYGLVRAGYPEVSFHPIPMRPDFTLVAADSLRVRSSPVRHARDTVALRFDDTSASLVISSDTLPSDNLIVLADGAGLLLHDCGGLHRDRHGGFGAHHASALQAGEVAAAAAAGALLLVHLDGDDPATLEALTREAAESYAGPVGTAVDGRQYRSPGADASAGWLR